MSRSTCENCGCSWTVGVDVKTPKCPNCKGIKKKTVRHKALAKTNVLEKYGIYVGVSVAALVLASALLYKLSPRNKISSQFGQEEIKTSQKILPCLKEKSKKLPENRR